ncbi:TonB-dependent receptor [Herbaspirillum sp. YR522]|uniref:TonB-dependent receptor n=1 Tax=Herbaspirillum sp. YR522 TaxID=1144342 RepID=UPI00026F64A4|nr:TonB-dependent receptor [Herbaspirillum sp. YR522]EJN10147.1 TonB-dependent siderophore receptor [Herbaspirillum sp. YR522]
MAQTTTFRGTAWSVRQRAASACTVVHLLLGASLLWPCLAAPAQAQTPLARAYDIAPGSLEEVLGRFGHDAGILLSFRPEITAGLDSPGLRGHYSVEQGLTALLADTPIVASRQANGGYLLARVGSHAEQAAPLPLVVINASPDRDATVPYAGGQLARSGSLGVLGAANVMDVPFSTLNYTATVLRDQQARTLADVVVNDASVRMLTSTGGFGDTFQIRGYSLANDDVGLNGLFGLSSAGHMPAAIVERVDVLKGPGTVLNGISPGGSIGGSINIVTKRAGETPLARLTGSLQSRAQGGLEADVGQRFGPDNAWGLRVNGVVKDGEGGISGGRQQLGVGALALDYRQRGLRWSLDAFSQREDVDGFRPQVGFLDGVTSIPAAPAGNSNFYAGSRLRLQDDVLASRLEVDLDPDLTLHGAIGYRNGASWQNLPTGSADAAGLGTLRNAYYDATTRTATADVGLHLRLSGAGVRHAIDAGLTQLRQEGGNAYVTSSGTASYSIYQATPLPPITDARTAPRKAYGMVLTSLTLTDTLSMLDDRLRLFVGARRQQVRYDSYDTQSGLQESAYQASALSPLLGVVLKPADDLALYANYTAGLTRGTIVPSGMVNAGEILPPYRSHQVETGVKLDWGRVMTSAAVFQIDNPSAVITQVAGTPSASTYGYDGQQRNRGLELAAYGEALPDVRLMASATFYDARLRRTTDHANDGHVAPGVPRRAFNLGLDWDTPWLAGLALSTRVLHTSSVYFNAENKLRLPGWTRVDIGARYSTRLGARPLLLRATVENLFNRDYWLIDKPYVTIAAARTVLLSASIDF